MASGWCAAAARTFPLWLPHLRRQPWRFQRPMWTAQARRRLRLQSPVALTQPTGAARSPPWQDSPAASDTCASRRRCSYARCSPGGARGRVRQRRSSEAALACTGSGPPTWTQRSSADARDGWTSATALSALLMSWRSWRPWGLRSELWRSWRTAAAATRTRSTRSCSWRPGPAAREGRAATRSGPRPGSTCGRRGSPRPWHRT
mmetsp:Transcript_18468/g.57917  ORF Transcript_18468/g.57917 Transcript_18468/m.57917 type:complete len:204 (+) Transcript_18468:276-887(+)